MNRAMMISLSLLVMCFLIRMPAATGMIMSPTLYLAVKGMDLSVVVEISTSKMYNNFTLLAVPPFTSAASIVNSNKVTDKVFDFSKALVGRWEGGLRHMNVIAFLMLSEMTGSAVADASGFRIMEIEAVHKEGYDNGFSAAITAGFAIIGPIFPPSIPLVIYGVIVGVSVENLFLIGMMPGVILVLTLCIYVCYIANRKNYPSRRKHASMELTRMTVSTTPALLTPIILLIGTYIGIITAIRVGAMIAFYALLIFIFTYHSMTLPEFVQVLKDTVKSMERIGIMLGAVYVFSYVIAVENLPFLIGNLISLFTTTKVTFLISASIILFTLGMLLDSAVPQLVLLPILCPIAQSLRTDTVHFGTVFALNTIAGLRIPPFDMLLFMVMGVSEEKMSTIIKEVMPMVLVTVLVLIFITFVPDVIMRLPRLFGR